MRDKRNMGCICSVLNSEKRLLYFRMRKVEWTTTIYVCGTPSRVPRNVQFITEYVVMYVLLVCLIIIANDDFNVSCLISGKCTTSDY